MTMGSASVVCGGATCSFHFEAGVALTSLVLVLGDGDVLRNGVAHFEAHRVFHLLLNTAAVGQDEHHVDPDQDTDYKYDDTGSDCVLTLHKRVLILDVLILVKLNAAFGLGG